MAKASEWKQIFHQGRRFLAKTWLKFFPNLTIIGVTGSYGKTNTVRAIAQVLAEKYQTLQTDLNLDTVYNLPITVLKLRPGDQKLVLEYGVDHQGEMERHLSLVKPLIAVVTGINPTHSEPELLESVEGIVEEKSKLLAALRPADGLALLNWDDLNVRKMDRVAKSTIIRYGFSRECDFWADNIEVDFSGTTFDLHYKGKKIKMTTGLIGRHFVAACLAAAAVGVNQGLTWPEIKQGLSKLEPLRGRLSIEKGPKNSILINDALRANPASTLAGLQTLKDLPAAKRRIAVLGEMGELGDSAEAEHQRVGRFLASLNIDYLVAIGPLQKLTAEQAVKAGMKKNRVFWVEDVRGAAQILKKLLSAGDLLYLKGSLLRHLERVIFILQGRKVSCTAVACHVYQPCQNCQKRSA